jgi:eukaryotic-like serine/threonine-protein kinase
MTNINITDAIVSFRKIKDIGAEGKNSEVFLAQDIHLDSEIVVKQITRQNLSLEKLFAESRILHSVAHTNISPVQYACRDDNFVYISMPYYSKGSLKSLISNENLSLRRIIKYSIDILSGLMHIHSNNLIHFDIKSDNILISDNDTALVADFGISAYLDPKNGLAEIKSFYRNTMPPELILSVDGLFDRRFDLYHFGLILYQMCNGLDEYNRQKNSFGTNDAFLQAIVKGEFPDRNVFPLHMPKELISLVKEILNTDVNKRPKDALEIINKFSKVPDEYLDWTYIKYPNGDEEWSKIFDSKVVKLVKISGVFTASKTMIDSGKTMNIAKYSGALSTDQIRDFFISGG